ncbi:MAG: alpha-ketoglutarate-dependent dioxygenase AlkB [Acidimicrobiales bacterium]
MAVMQATLLDMMDSPGPRPLGSSVEHSEIGHGAWVDLRPTWLAGADALFDRLLPAVAWKAERRRMYDRVVDVPRLVAFYGEGDRLPDSLLEVAMAALNEHYATGPPGDALATAGLCLYRDGRDSVAWHGDTIGRGAVEDTLVAIVSLGAPRRLLLRPRSGGPAMRYELGHGDLFVMGGTCQRTFEHAVPKTVRTAGPRISVQFRPPGVT